MNYLEQIGAPDHPIQITPLKSGGRSDWHVSACRETSALPVPFAETGIIDQLRVFFDRLDAEAEARKHDPVAMVNAMARMEALAADVRTVTAAIRKYAAEAMADYDVRRMTIDGIATVEATSAAERTDWQDQALLTAMIHERIAGTLVSTSTGEQWEAHELAASILSWLRPAWRLTPIRDAGLDPDDYSTQPKDEDGKPIRTPGVRVHDNSIRKITTKESMR
jgi:hypothetical protein